MLASREHCVTSERVPRGSMPEWLRDQIKRQSLGEQSTDTNLHGRILVVYPTEKSRMQLLSSIGLRGAVDRTLHHTIESLISSLVADLRMPRVLSNDGPLLSVIHTECRREAARLGFPLINPLPDMSWGKGKTEALAELHYQLSREMAVSRWQGPGIVTFRRVIERLEEKLRFTHPDMAVGRIIDSLESGITPFTVSDIDGIIMLDHSPTLCRSHTEMLLSLSTHSPIHQLANPGNFRLGHHGSLLVDEHPVKDPHDLPNWVPGGRTAAKAVPSAVTRILLRREAHSFDITTRLVLERLTRSDSQIIIIDPAVDKNRHRWEQQLGAIGISLERTREPPSSHPIGHWILRLASLAHGPDAFSLENLRALSLQSSITPFEITSEHPKDSQISPSADSELLTKLARNEHVLGGPGALLKWIETLSRPPSDERDGPSKEATQWWLLCLANSLFPILRGPDRELIRDLGQPVGCYTGSELPLPNIPLDGDRWLNNTLSLIDLDSEMQIYRGQGLSPAAAVHALVSDREVLREMQRRSGQGGPTLGSDWVEELTSLAEQSSAAPGGPNFSGNVSVLSPREALGCTSDMMVMANLSSSSWDLRVPKTPFLGEEERHSLGILRPDSPIRDARHSLQHILQSSPEVIILDPSMDETAPPSAPIREWARDSDVEGIEEGDYQFSIAFASPRDTRQDDGLRIRESRYPSKTPINPSAISIPIDPHVQRDRERRQPSIAEEDGYLPEDAGDHIFSLEGLKFHGRNPPGVENPRTNRRWPIVGGLSGGKQSLSIDPRPLNPSPTGSSVNDSRHGHSEGMSLDVPVWSPTRLQTWLRCPRSGWLSRELDAGREELQGEDIDNRTYGELLHNVHHDIIANILDFPTSEERTFDGESGYSSVGKSGLNPNEMMKIALESLDSRAPWLERSDAVSTQRLRSLTGMSRQEWSSWIADPSPLPPVGRVGSIVSAELKIADSAPISIEWMIGKEGSNNVDISLPKELSGYGDTEPIKVRGWIDRVDLLPLDPVSGKWVDNDGDDSVAPIRVHGTGWRPKRIIAIRDIKTSESPIHRNRHYKGLLEELQLAVYARAWEEAHPGDLVLAAGISVFGHNSDHLLEVSTQYSESHKGLDIGTRSSITSTTHRFPDEDERAQSDHFRSWMAQRLSVALKVASNANSGKVHPTPSPGVCGYCPVRETCNVRMEGSF